MFFFFNYFIILQVFTSTFIFFSMNPIHSILLLILLFFESAVVLSFVQLEFLSILFILIYVGAIAILFLFVVMMLQLKLINLEILFFLPFIFSISGLFIIFSFSQTQPFTYFHSSFSDYSFFLFSVEETFSELQIIGQFLYNYSIFCFLLAGIILLEALIGSIVLSLEYNKLNSNIIFRKLSKHSAIISFFK